jgi:hypothetical protein
MENAARHDAGRGSIDFAAGDALDIRPARQVPIPTGHFVRRPTYPAVFHF